MSSRLTVSLLIALAVVCGAYLAIWLQPAELFARFRVVKLLTEVNGLRPVASPATGLFHG